MWTSVSNTRRHQTNDRAMLCGEAVVRCGRGIAEVVGLGDLAGECQDVAFSESIGPHFGRYQQVAAPACAFQPSLATQRADHVIGGLRADTEHVDDFLAPSFLAALLCHAEDDAALPGRE